MTRNVTRKTSSAAVVISAFVMCIFVGVAAARAEDEKPADKMRVSPEPMKIEENVSDDSKSKLASKYISAMKEDLKRLLALLEEARESKDVVKLNYVNEKLTQIKGLLRISEQAQDAMEEALVRRDHEVAEHEFTKISISAQKCQQLLAEAESSVGELAVYSGETKVTVEGENYKGTDPTTVLIPPLPVVERPPQVSPYQ